MKSGGLKEDTVSVKVTHNPLRGNRCEPQSSVFFFFLFIRMGDRGGFNKFGGKWQSKKHKQKGFKCEESKLNRGRS